MAYRDIIPSNGVLVVDIRDTLGTGSNNLLDYFSPALINPWAGKKPVNGGPSAYGKSGFTKHITIKGVNVYQYEPVKGGVANPYIMEHFVGYKHKAATPFFSLPNSKEVWLQPNGERIVNVTYLSSDIDFRKDGYNALIITQEMNGGGQKIVGGKLLRELSPNQSNSFDIKISGVGLAVGNHVNRNLIAGFGNTSATNSDSINSSNSNLYKVVGYMEQQFKALIRINCSYDGLQPPPPQQWGRIIIKLVNAPASILAAIESIKISFASNTGDTGEYMRQLDIGYNENKMPNSYDDRTFKKGSIRLWWKNPQTGRFEAVGQTLIQNPYNSPANGASFARIVYNQIKDMQIKRPSGSDKYEYEARWQY